MNDGNVISKDPDYKMISKQKKICSAKYFDLYFTETNNTYAEIGDIVDNLISEINKRQPFIKKQTALEGVLSTVHYSHHKEIFERVQLYADDLEQEIIYDFVKLLFNNIEIIDDSRQFWALGTRSRVAVILHVLLNKITDTEYNIFLDSVTKEYNKLSFLQDILYWFTSDKGNININERKELLGEIIKKMVSYVLNNNVNLYEDLNYMPKNIRSLYRVYKEEQDKIKYYMKENINEENIFRFLNDVMDVSIGAKYRYSFNKENLEIFIKEDNINAILDKVKPKTKDEKFVLEVYRSYQEDFKDEWGQAGIMINQEKKLVL